MSGASSCPYAPCSRGLRDRLSCARGPGLAMLYIYDQSVDEARRRLIAIICTCTTPEPGSIRPGRSRLARTRKPTIGARGLSGSPVPLDVRRVAFVAKRQTSP